jgi:hypothetical protein
MADSHTPPELDDPAGHFPYKAEVAYALVEENPPAGPDGPDDDRVRVEDFLSADIVDATDVYVQAQADYLRDPGDGTRELLDQAAQELVEARQAHRASRPAGPTVVGIRASRVGE